MRSVSLFFVNGMHRHDLDVVAPDLVGFGRSDKPVTPFTLGDMAEAGLGLAQQRLQARTGFALLMLFVVLVTFGEVGDLLRR